MVLLMKDRTEVLGNVSVPPTTIRLKTSLKDNIAIWKKIFSFTYTLELT